MDSDAAQVAVQIERAQTAFETARTVEPAVRAGWLEAIADGMEAAVDDLVPIASDETHLLDGRLRGELARTVFQLRLLAEETRSGLNLDAVIDHADSDWPMGARPDLRRINEPLGVVGVFGASNFPFAFSVIGGDSASALAAGCAVVHKGHPAHERLAVRTAEVVEASLNEAGAPEGLFGLILGREAGEVLVDHPLVQAIGFTGSTAVGLALAARAAARPQPIPFFGELGSTNPVFVTEAAWADRRDRILSEYVGSMSLGMGQFCTKPGFLVVPATAHDELAGALAAAAAAVAWHPMLTPGLRASFARSFAEVDGDARFVELFSTDPTDPTDSTDSTDAASGSADAAPPLTILGTPAATFYDTPDLLEHEMFGPASVIVEYDDEAELVRLADLVGGQLTTSVHANDDEAVGDLVTTLSAHSGRVLWNGWPTGVTVSFAQQHGGPYPATTVPGTTSVGTSAITRFMRPVSYQSFPAAQLPPGLRDDNPWGIPQRIDGEWVSAR